MKVITFKTKDEVIDLPDRYIIKHKKVMQLLLEEDKVSSKVRIDRERSMKLFIILLMRRLKLCGVAYEGESRKSW